MFDLKKCVAWSASVPAAAAARFLSSRAGSRSCRRNCPQNAHHNSEQWITDTKARTVRYRPKIYVQTSVADQDPYVFGPPGSGSTSQRYGSGSIQQK